MSAELERVIIERIRREGPITFEAFMDTALYHRRFGYYMSDRPVIGPEGDYYTSTHLHPLFGWLLAVQIEEMRTLMGEPEGFTIVEIGAGRGYMAEGIISRIEERFGWKGWRYVIVERNPHMWRRQEALLGRHGDLIRWCASLSELGRFSGCVITNEVVDSFPVHLIESSGDGFSEIYVSVEDGGFREVRGELSRPELTDYIRRYRVPSVRGYRTEVNLRAGDFLGEVVDHLEEGFMITIDYGYASWEYYAEERGRGTLLCYHRHTCRDDPYRDVGEQDITAHVNFSALRDWAEARGVQTVGYCPQGTFLVSLGMDEIISERLQVDPGFRADLPKIKGLLFGMGETHKVLVQYKGRGGVPELRGFRLRNRLGML